MPKRPGVPGTCPPAPTSGRGQGRWGCPQTGSAGEGGRAEGSGNPVFHLNQRWLAGSAARSPPAHLCGAAQQRAKGHVGVACGAGGMGRCSCAAQGAWLEQQQRHGKASAWRPGCPTAPAPPPVIQPQSAVHQNTSDGLPRGGMVGGQGVGRSCSARCLPLVSSRSATAPARPGQRKHQHVHWRSQAGFLKLACGRRRT